MNIKKILNPKIKGQAPHLWKISPLTPFFFLKRLIFTKSNLWENRHSFGVSGNKKRNLPKVSGQVMIIAVTLLGGSLIAASTIAGYLMLLQLRRASDITNSARAIFAADAGVEWSLYQINKGEWPKPQFDEDFVNFEATTSTDNTVIKSVGRSGNISRALELTITTE